MNRTSIFKKWYEVFFPIFGLAVFQPLIFSDTVAATEILRQNACQDRVGKTTNAGFATKKI